MSKKCKVCGKSFNGNGDIGPTCLEHQGEIGKYYVKKSGNPNPDEFISLVELCDIAERNNKSRGWMVKLTGGDGGVKPPQFEVFTIYLFGKRKYCKREAVKSLHELVSR